MTTQDQQLIEGRNPGNSDGTVGLTVAGSVLSALVIATAVGTQVL